MSAGNLFCSNGDCAYLCRMHKKHPEIFIKLYMPHSLFLANFIPDF